MAQQTPSSIVRRASTLSILWGVSLIVLGMLAVGSPFVACRSDQRIRCLAHSFGRRGPLDRCFSQSRSWQFDLESVGRPRISLFWRVLDHASSTGCCIADVGAGITLSC